MTADNMYDVIASIGMPGCRADRDAEEESRRPSAQDLEQDAYYDRMDARRG